MILAILALCSPECDAGTALYLCWRDCSHSAPPHLALGSRWWPEMAVLAAASRTGGRSSSCQCQATSRRASTCSASQRQTMSQELHKAWQSRSLCRLSSRKRLKQRGQASLLSWMRSKFCWPLQSIVVWKCARGMAELTRPRSVSQSSRMMPRPIPAGVTKRSLPTPQAGVRRPSLCTPTTAVPTTLMRLPRWAYLFGERS